MEQSLLFDLPPTELPIGINRFLIYWEGKKNLRHHRNKNTKTYKEAVTKISRLTSGTLFTRHSPVEEKYWGMKFAFPHFQKSVDHFSDNYPQYPALYNVCLSDFIYNPYAQKIYSPFLLCLERSQQPTLICSDSKLLTAVVKAYGEAILGSKHIVGYALYEVDAFVKATNLLVQKLQETESLHDPLLLKTPQDKANLLLNAAKYCAKGDTKKLTISFLSAPWVIKEIPLFMKNQGYLRSPAAFSIYRRL
jgi:hypothetical protein